MNAKISDKLKYILDYKQCKITTAGQILEKDFGPDVWTIDQLIPEQSITAISGIQGSFKTWLTLEMARCLATGEDFLGKFKTKQGNIMFVDKENNLKHIQKRMQKLGMNNISDQIFYLDLMNPYDDFFIDKDIDFEKLLYAIENLEIKTVVFDSLVRVHTGDENDARNISKVMGLFRKITNIGVNVIFIHHHRKENSQTKKNPNSMRGSSDISAAIDCLLMVDRSDDENSLRINQAKLRQSQAIEPFSIFIQDNKETGAISFVYNGEYNPNKVAKEEAKNEISTLLNEKDNVEMSRQDIIEALSEDYKPATVDEALKELVPDVLTKRRGPSNKFYFSVKK